MIHNIGFLGVENFDLILYLAKTLKTLRYQVLIVNLSSSDAIDHCFEDCMDIDPAKDVLNYREIGFLRRIPTQEECQEYEIKLFIFEQDDLDQQEEFIKSLEQVLISFNSYPNQINRIMKQYRKVKEINPNIRILLRDIINEESEQELRKAIVEQNQDDNISTIYFAEEDIMSAIHCQKEKRIRYDRVSKGMKKFIREQVISILPEEQNRIKKAMKVAQRNEK